MSVLDDLGEEVTGILAPVSLCMALTVALVKAVNPTGESNRESVPFATAYYDEQESDSIWTKFSGSVINALIFVVIIGAMTFVLFCLFKYQCTKCIYGYMGFALLMIFFFLTGAVVIELLNRMNWHFDAISLCFILYNFSVVGMLGLFFWTVPVVVKQGYLVVVSVIVAYIFTWIPEWSTWVMLIFMSIYDICAVLIPGGPLKALVELAVERGESIPALVYEVRPSRPGGSGWRDRYRQRNETRSELVSQYPTASMTASVVMASDGGNEVEQESPPTTDNEDEALISPSHMNRPQRSDAQDPPRSSNEPASRSTIEAPPTAISRDSDDFGLPDSLKLGLGDFIFYSLLVGRAAFHDFMTVFAAYLGIVAGMGLTLLLLALYQRALPALPFSIALGLVFYFLTKLVLEPFILPLAISLTFF